MKAVVVDDERLARSELRRLLAAHPEIEVIGEAGGVDEAAAVIERIEPDLLFLDIEMPGGSGFDLLERLDAVPIVIFTTAYDEFALRAFEVSALDYLVKPIDPARLARTISRIVTPRAGDHTSDRGPAVGPRGVRDTAAQPLDDTARLGAGRVLRPRHRVFVKDGERCWFVELGDIRLFESAGGYTRVYFGGEKPLISRSLGQLEAKLDPDVFFRANRHQIVNLDRVERIDPWSHGAFAIHVEGGHEVVMSRRRAAQFRELRSV